jgi:hypothetical protein
MNTGLFLLVIESNLFPTSALFYENLHPLRQP